MPKKIKNPRIEFYKRGEKGRQQYLANNISCVTAFMTARLSNYFNIIISFPIKSSTTSISFPRVRTIFLNNEEDIPLFEIAEERIQLIKIELKNKNPDKKNRTNFIMHFELYHLLYDLLYLIEDVEIENEVEEKSGLSGDYIIRVAERIYKWEEIKEIGENIINKIYNNRQKGEKRRLIKKGSLRDLFI